MKRLSPPLLCLALSLRAAAAAGEPAAAGAMPASSAPHPFSARDLVGFERLGEPQPSPDGRWIVFTRRSYDWDANKTSTHLWLVSSDGQALRPLTAAGAADTSPRWSPDGRTIAFLSDRGGSTQIYTIDPLGGEAAPLTRFPVEIGTFRWSPDGRRLAFSAEVYPDCADLKCTADRDKARADDPVKASIFTSLPIRHWDAWEDGKRSHLFVWSVAGGEPVDLMKGADADAPTKPFGGAEEYSWSPDGRSVAFTAKMVKNPAWSTDLDVYLAAADGSGYRCLSEENEAVDREPAFSPDGRSIAWLAMERPGYEADRQRVVVHDLASGRRRALTEAWDRSAGSILWSRDGRRIFVTAEEEGRQRIFAIDAGGGARSAAGATKEAGATKRISLLVAEGYNSALATGPDDRLVFLRDTLASPAEVFTALADGSGQKALTAINAPRLAAVQMSRPEEFFFTGASGARVQGWILRPVGFEPGRKYPVAFLVHGGPQGAWTDHFHYRWNMQAFAGAGYVTVAVNFHGSTGFGQAFTDAINGDWGGKPFEDLMKGLDHVLAAYPFADGGKVCALGASYGGYMINWMNGHTDRFRCLVAHDGEIDLQASYYATEELWFPEWEFGGTPWERAETYERWSPAASVGRWRTPTLVVHGARDFRLPETEGFATFTALQRRGIPSKLLYFPDENHWVLKPRNSVFWHETVLAWLEQWLKGSQDAR
jgi:dipeptidyl aminopeptidase/acylaminoacyl peptidase